METNKPQFTEEIMELYAKLVLSAPWPDKGREILREAIEKAREDGYEMGRDDAYDNGYFDGYDTGVMDAQAEYAD